MSCAWAIRSPLVGPSPAAASSSAARSGVVDLGGDSHRPILTPARGGGTIGRLSTTEEGMPELRAEVENGPWPREPEEVCDLVMKGGVASGVVYPGAILALAKRYRFRNVGGTSAGAIAATVTAAAELGRREGSDGGFERLRELADAICEPGRVRGLFQPGPENRRVFELAMRMMEAKAQGAGARRRVVTDSLRALWLPIALLAPRLDGGRLRRGLRALPLARLVVGAHLAGPRRLGRGRRRLPRRLRGDPGRRAAGTGARADPRRPGRRLRPLPRDDASPGSSGPALSDWLHVHIQRCAGRTAADAPLTFADLKDAEDDSRSVSLQLMTTDVSAGPPRAAAAPRGQRVLVRRGRDRAARPREVAEWMREQARRDDRARRPDALTRCRAQRMPSSWPRG